MRPAELLVQRIEQHARHRPEPGRTDQRHEADGRRRPGAVQPDRPLLVQDLGHQTSLPKFPTRKRVARAPPCVKIWPCTVVAAVHPHRVAVLALEPVVGYDLTIPPTVLGAATRSDGTPLYDVQICGLDRWLRSGPARASAIVPDHGAETLAEADTVIIPGTYDPPAPVRGDPARTSWPRRSRTIRPGTRIASICTGAFVLAAAGLLDGRPATTHWARAEQFRELYPEGPAEREPAVRRRRRHHHLGRARRRGRSLPAPGPDRLRQRGRQPRRPALRRTAVA